MRLHHGPEEAEGTGAAKRGGLANGEDAVGFRGNGIARARGGVQIGPIHEGV